jgi:dynein light chain LC8-type
MTEQEVAASIKRRMTERYPADVWQVFVGRNFGSWVTHEDGKYIYFYIGQTGFCVFAS